jgi:hypothetical protein
MPTMGDEEDIGRLSDLAIERLDRRWRAVFESNRPIA